MITYIVRVVVPNTVPAASSRVNFDVDNDISWDLRDNKGPGISSYFEGKMPTATGNPENKQECSLHALLPFLQTQSQTSLTRLYQRPSSCLSIFR
jgi:hypothetical protein